MIVSTINMMDTMTTDKKRTRRNHSPALKAQILTECEAPGASVAKVAMTHGINANIVHGWRKLAHEHTVGLGATTAFVPLAIESAAAPERRIDVELRRGAISMTMSWPLSASAEMTVWMREFLQLHQGSTAPSLPESQAASSWRASLAQTDEAMSWAADCSSRRLLRAGSTTGFFAQGGQ